LQHQRVALGDHPLPPRVLAAELVQEELRRVVEVEVDVHAANLARARHNATASAANAAKAGSPTRSPARGSFNAQTSIPIATDAVYTAAHGCSQRFIFQKPHAPAA